MESFTPLAVCPNHVVKTRRVEISLFLKIYNNKEPTSVSSSQSENMGVGIPHLESTVEVKSAWGAGSG